METPAPKAQGRRGNSPSVPPTPSRSPGLSERLLKRGDKCGSFLCPSEMPMYPPTARKHPSQGPEHHALETEPSGRTGWPPRPWGGCGPGEGASPTWQLSATDTRPGCGTGTDVSTACWSPLSHPRSFSLLLRRHYPCVNPRGPRLSPPWVGTEQSLLSLLQLKSSCVCLRRASKVRKLTVTPKP